MITESIFDFRRLDHDRPSAWRLHERFAAEGYVHLPAFLTSVGLALLRQEARELEVHARRRDFLMASMNNSPRHMTTIGGHTILKHSELISELYADQRLRHFLGDVTDIQCLAIPDEVERFVINYLHETGDVHGAHFDDHPIAFVTFLEAPSTTGGGELEVVPDAANLNEIDGDHVRTYRHSAGDCYVLRSDTSAHRVRPLVGQCRRVVLNMAFASAASVGITSDSASLLYA
jgi:hypothetical protein